MLAAFQTDCWNTNSCYKQTRKCYTAQCLPRLEESVCQEQGSGLSCLRRATNNADLASVLGRLFRTNITWFFDFKTKYIFFPSNSWWIFWKGSSELEYVACIHQTNISLTLFPSPGQIASRNILGEQTFDRQNTRIKIALMALRPGKPSNLYSSYLMEYGPRSRLSYLLWTTSN